MNLDPSALGRLGDVQVNLSVELGRTELTLKDVLALQQGSVVSLNRLTDELLDVTANGKPIARAEVVAQDGRFALRVVELVGGTQDSVPSASWPPANAPKEAPQEVAQPVADPSIGEAPQSPPTP